MSNSSQTTNQSQSSSTNPWAPASGLLNNLISGYGSQSTAVTPGQSAALSNLTSDTANLPNFGAQGANAIGNLFSSSTQPQVGTLQNAYDTLQSNLGSTASGANLNPYSTPGFSDAINTAMSDITNQVKGVYAGSGRDPSGAGSFAGSLGRGLTQGIAPTIASQYNQNYGNMVNANNSLFSGAGSTASGITNLNQTQLGNGIAGITGASSIPGLYTSPDTAQLAAANAQYSQPYSNLAQLLQPSTALAGLGSSSTGQGTSTATNSPSLLSSIQQGMQVGGGGLSALASLLALSDARLKENIAPVGKLHDGQNVYSYNMKGDTTPQIGLLAQEVAQHEPDAVAQHPSGALMVNYAKATHKSRMMAAGPVGKLRNAA